MLTIESMKQIKFPKRTYAEWQAGAEKTLGGKTLEDALNTKTIEEITLEPLYTKEMLDKLGEYVPVQVNAVQHSKRRPGWFVAQEASADSAQEYLAKIKKDLARGNEMVVYTSSQQMRWTDSELKQLAELILQYPIYFKLTSEDRDILRVFNFITSDKLDSVHGVVYSEDELEAPVNIRTKLVDTIPVHHAGGTAIHELGVALSILAETIKSDAFAESAKKSWIRFAVDTQFFQEIAKLRAFRVLWQAFCSAYGKETAALPVFTETSVRSYSKLDPYVNLLRAGNATFAAVLGGTEAHTVHPHDFLTGPDEASRRIARNVQLVIKEETHVSHVVDVSAGSYFIESLTKEYVEAGWNYFLEIEQAGGYSEVIKSGWLTDDIQAKWIERKENAAAQKTSLIGTNVYANPQEAVKDQGIADSHLEFLTAKRLASPFEKLRARSKELVLRPAIIHLGQLKDVKKTSDFVQGFLAVGGIEAMLSPELQDAESVNNFLKENNIEYAVLCGSPDMLERVIPGLSSDSVIDVAGKFDGSRLSQWQNYGIADMVYAGQHIVSKLEQIFSLGKKEF